MKNNLQFRFILLIGVALLGYKLFNTPNTSSIGKQPKENDQYDKEIVRLKELQSSVIDDRQKQLDALKNGEEPEEEPIKERMEQLAEIADSAAGYKGIVMKNSVKSMESLLFISQKYQESSKGIEDSPEHDLIKLGERRASFVTCKFLAHEIALLMQNYRSQLERDIPEVPQPIPFDDFDQNVYTATRHGFINGSCKNITPTVLDFYKTEEQIWDIQIEIVDLLIAKYDNWEISPDGSIAFDKQPQLDEFNGLQQKLSQVSSRSLELNEKMLNEKRKRLDE